MSYVSVANSQFQDALKSWMRDQSEVLVLIRYSYAAGSREFRLFTSFDSLSEVMGRLPHLACVTVFRLPQLPIRGVVDDAFVTACLQGIPNGSEYLVTETEPRVYGCRSWFHYGSGESHAELRDDLEECRGAPVAAGLYPPWLHDNEEVISAVVPDKHGIARSGIY